MKKEIFIYIEQTEMYIPKKSIELLTKAPAVWAGAFKTPQEFVKFVKITIKHIEQRQIQEEYNNMYIFCNDYLKNITPTLNKLNTTLPALLDTALHYRIVTKRKHNEYRKLHDNPQNLWK